MQTDTLRNLALPLRLRHRFPKVPQTKRVISERGLRSEAVSPDVHLPVASWHYFIVGSGRT